MTAVRQAHAQQLVPRFHCSEVRGHVGLRTGVRLHVCVLSTKELLRPVDRDLLRDVDKLAAAIIAFARITLGVLVREDRSGCFQNCGGSKIFARNQLERSVLAFRLTDDCVEYFGILPPQLFDHTYDLFSSAIAAIRRSANLSAASYDGMFCSF